MLQTAPGPRGRPLSASIRYLLLKPISSPLTVSGNGALVARRRRWRSWCEIFSTAARQTGTAHGAFQLVGDDQGDAVDGGEQLALVSPSTLMVLYCGGDGLSGRPGIPPPAGGRPAWCPPTLNITCRAPWATDGGLVTVGADLFHLAQGRAGHHEGEGLGSPVLFVNSLPAAGPAGSRPR